MLILHTADWHVGAFTGSKTAAALARAVLDAVGRILDEAASRGASAVVVSGDMFDAPLAVDFGLVKGLASLLSSARSRGVEVVAVPGNHDYDVSGESYLDLFAAAGLVRIPPAREAGGRLVLSPVRVGDVDFYGLPGRKRSKEAEYIEAGAVAVERGSAPKRVLVAHTAFKGPGWDDAVLSERLGDAAKRAAAVARWALSSGFDYIALGHLHLPYPSVLGRVAAAYPGAPVGNNRLDLLDTCYMEKRGVRRRAIAVDLSGGEPRAAAVEPGVPRVTCVELYYGQDTAREIKEAVHSAEPPAAVVLTVRGVPADKYHDVLAKVYEAWSSVKGAVAVLPSLERAAAPRPAARQLGSAGPQASDPVREAIEEAAARKAPRVRERAYRAFEILSSDAEDWEKLRALEKVFEDVG